MELEPRLSEAVITALTSTDPHAARCQREVGDVMGSIIAGAFPADFDAHSRDDIARVLGHVWFSSLIGWVNRWYGINHVGEELEIAAVATVPITVGIGMSAPRMRTENGTR